MATVNDPSTPPAKQILFVGNSLTYVNDLPGIVEALAGSAGGTPLEVTSVVAPDFALIDHWNVGKVRTEIARGGWEFVVLQQGPSSVEVNRDSLRIWTKMFNSEISAVGARTALYSVWPMASRPQDFPRAIESYTLAAGDVNGLLLPAAAAWQAAMRLDSQVELYAADGLHPSENGSYLAALVIYAKILERSPIGLPRKLRLRRGTTIDIAENIAAILQQAAAEVAAAGPSGVPALEAPERTVPRSR